MYKIAVCIYLIHKRAALQKIQVLLEAIFVIFGCRVFKNWTGNSHMIYDYPGNSTVLITTKLLAWSKISNVG